jgi:hypothetical protein
MLTLRKNKIVSCGIMYYYMNVLVSCYDILREIIEVIVILNMFIHQERKIKNIFKILCNFNP